MNPKVLIDAVVQQTTILIAQLSTAAGVRSPLSTVADQVFVELSREIERQGVSRKVAADMFGMALRTYQCKVQRLEESFTAQGQTLWEGVLEFVESTPGVNKAEILERFRRDSPQSVGAVLKDLGDSGLLYRAGVGVQALYRAVPEQERQALAKRDEADALAALIRVAIYRGATSIDALTQRLGAKREAIESAVKKLTAEGSVSRAANDTLSTDGILIQEGADIGWEAAVFDHFQALVVALTNKLNARGDPATREGQGGSTLTFEIDEEHPLSEEVLGTLGRVRTELNDLWRRVGESNQQRMIAGELTEEWEPDQVVTFYFGQSIVSPQESS